MNAISAEKMVFYSKEFNKNGFVLIPEVISKERVDEIKCVVDGLFSDEKLKTRTDTSLADPRYIQHLPDKENKWVPFLLRNTVQLHQVFREMLVEDPIWSIAKHILGDDCKFCGQNVIRNTPGVAISSWHIDGELHFPVPDFVDHHHPDIPPPNLWITVQVPLTDILSDDDGPTQYVPGSHLSGKEPNDPEHPTFLGRGPKSVLCKAGDIYIQNPQCWHRGAPNNSNTTRYVFQTQYAVHWAYRRFGLANNVPIEESERSACDEQILSVLGY